MSGSTDKSSRQRRTAVSIESRAALIALLAMVLFTVLAFVIFLGKRPALSGDGSVGSLSSLFAAVVGAGVFSASYVSSLRGPESSWLRRSALARRILDVAALAFAHAAIAFMLGQAVFYLFQNAFTGLTLDPFAGGLFVGLSCAASGYAVYLSGARINTYSLSNLLAIFLVSGALTSMVTTDNPSWWEINFSVLGASDSGLSAYAFNTTLIVSGLVITTLASYMTQDLRRWSELNHDSSTQASRIQWSLVLLGILAAGVGLVPVDVAMPLHNTSAIGMILVFVVIIVCLPWWVPSFPRSFFVTSWVLLAGAGFSVLLFFPFGYYNLTGMELVTTAIIFGWLVLFIRNIAALVEDSEDLEHADSSSTRDSLPNRDSSMSRQWAIAKPLSYRELCGGAEVSRRRSGT
ncbi:hypothetical protein FHU41_002406 [Psychromicrobium silvestre]|uniref:DUF998 domain-containing protein n=1 Tax=Psychromicrobium silvestre TaxID=1645614 RepID=A0A7Y9S8N1_9MICC|nr:hypothetical protein [Psychromicrobium silvestre]NYE96156.1 hypothetical protein [Psychromicrobium silvestre]